MEIKISTENGRVPITIMHIDGNIDSATSNLFQTKADELIKSGARYILIDLAHCPYMSSASLRALHEIFKELNAIHPDATLSEDEIKKGINAGTYKSPYLKLLNVSNETKMVFKTSGFDMFLEFYDDMKTAIAAF
ncbi:MAG: STAS domain-containing protein [Anaerolineales bacterium]|nr:STAS domain-containing protein [Anaerolineales bacterium]